MKKILALLLCLVSLSSFTELSLAEEPLLDNNLDLKTDRLNQAQEENTNAQSFVEADQLFQPEMIKKVQHAKQVEDQKRQEEENDLFLQKLPKTKENDPSQLFTGNETTQVATKTAEADTTTASAPLALFPLILGLVLITAVTLVLYYTRKRGKAHGR